MAHKEWRGLILTDAGATLAEAAQTVQPALRQAKARLSAKASAARTGFGYAIATSILRTLWCI